MRTKSVYVISAVFSAASIFLLLNADNAKALLLGISNLLLFGVCGFAFYMLNRKGCGKIERQQKITLKQSRRKLIVLLLACSSFTICCWLFLPFNHLFDGNSRYSPALGYIIGIAGILLFGSGAVCSTVRLITPKTVMQISNEGLLIPKGKKQELIRWDEILAISHNDNFLFIHLSSPDAAVDRTVNVPVAIIGYGTDQIEDLIKEKINNGA